MSGVLQADERPNVVLIMADDMGYECVGANGGTSYQTPRLNDLARTGLRFENFHSQPICTPTRVQLMTGLYNHRNYIRFGLLDPEAYTFGHHLKSAGYSTYIAGKWQLDGGLTGPGHFGFDGYTLWQVNRRPPRYPNPGLEIDGQQIDFTNGEYGPDLVCQAVCDFICRPHDKPFFAYYPMILPHFPHVPTPDSADWDPTAMGKEGKGKNKYFADMVAYTDKLVGRVIDTLQEAGLREQTLVVFIGDNGTNIQITSQMGDRTIPGGKGRTTDNGTHVPCIVNWPGTIQPGVHSGISDLTDWFPTFAELANKPLPHNVPFDGINLVPVLKDASGPRRQWSYCWYHRDGNRDKATQHARTVQYKLYATGELYDVIADPQEEHPLAQDAPELKQTRALLQQVLNEMAATEWQKTK
ncbi:MAG: sulfatase-like hydrolase/transferase [Planctomycetaceae bacterium]|nr:sulfatase-like hydrolase/transferase [Planctomycetaceae bacterium]